MDHIFIFTSEYLYNMNNDYVVLDKMEQNYSSYTFIIPEQTPSSSYTYFFVNEEHDKYIIQ